MKIIFVLTTLLMVFLLAACTGDQPVLSLETSKFDFGDVVNGAIMEKDVVVRNIGKAELIVDTVTTTCGCTTGTLDPMTILPGETANLHIEFDSGTHGPELTGHLLRQIIIISNDPEQPEVTVEFIANIIPPEAP